jgi:hypothetical protein
MDADEIKKRIAALEVERTSEKTLLGQGISEAERLAIRKNMV